MDTGYQRKPSIVMDDSSADDRHEDALLAIASSEDDTAVSDDGEKSPPLRRILVAVDAVAIVLGWAAAFSAGFFLGEPTFGPLTAIAQTVFMLGAGGLLLSVNGLYRRRICAIRSAEVARIGRTSLALAVATVVVLASVGRDSAIVAGVVGGAVWFSLLTFERGLLREWIRGRRATGDFRAPVMVIGGDLRSTDATADFLAEHQFLGFEVRGIVCPAGQGAGHGDFPWLGPPTDLVEQARRSGASGLILDAGSLTGHQVSDITQRLATTPLHVHINTGLRGIEPRRISVSSLADETFLHVAPLGLSRRQVAAKRLVDVTIGGMALLALSPVLLVSAVVVWAYDRGPILYRQERVGLSGEHFTVFKLRSMVVDADARLADLMEENGRDGPLFKMAHDPRITPFGRFLRASSIDEIPQLFNVLEGTMSLVGPRPALPAEVAQFDDHLNQRLTVKPGVTGLWQVEARDLPSFDLYRRYDILYVQNWSIGLDLAVIARTAAVVGMRAVHSIIPRRRDASQQTVLE